MEKLVVAISMLSSQWAWIRWQAEAMACSPGMDMEPRDVIRMWNSFFAMEEFILNYGAETAFQLCPKGMKEEEFLKMLDGEGINEECRFVPKSVGDCCSKIVKLLYSRAEKAPEEETTRTDGEEFIVSVLGDNFADKEYYIGRADEFMAIGESGEEMIA
jgi:hypothetical protein